MPAIDRGSVWIVDLGMAAKIRPCLVVAVPTDPTDRMLFTVVPHTTSTHGTRFEVVVPVRALAAGAFDVQQVASIGPSRFLRRIAQLTPAEMAPVEDALRRWQEL